jgi:very-short-patch-repair endonuclease
MGKRPDHIHGLVFDRHRSRRAQRVPTLSVLIGDAEAAEWCWSRWQRSRAAAFAAVTGESLAEMLGAWLSKGSVFEALRREILRRGASVRGVSREEFELTLRTFVRGQRREGVDEISAWVDYSPELVSIVAGGDAEGLLSWALGGFPRSLVEVDRALPDGLPGIFARVSRAPSPSIFDEIVAILIRLAEAVPKVELAMSVTASDLAAWRQRADARKRHLVAEGSIQIEAAAGDKVARGRRQTAGAGAVRGADGDDEMAPSGAPSRLEYDAAEFARSRAERTLFEHLEARARTRGLFRLNGTIPEAFGGRHLEVDLLSEELGVALEIDGYHHFRDAAAYRRDRDKDVRLQRLGYTVVRVLATDVDVELDYVTDTIDRVVDHEKQKRAP